MVILDGGTNDAYESNDRCWGSVDASTSASTLDLNTFAGNFENTLVQIKQKWPNAKIIFVAVHRLAGGRTVERQDTIHEIQLTACSKWGVTIANLYDECMLNTRNDDYRIKYSFDALGSDGLPATLQAGSYTATSPTGTHPNFFAIEEYFVPTVAIALRKDTDSQTYINFEAETLYNTGNVTLSNSIGINSWADLAAHGGGWFITNTGSVPVGTTVIFQIDVPDNTSYTRIITGYKAKNSGRAVVSLAVNGVEYSTINMQGTQAYVTSGTQSPYIKLNSGEVNMLTYTVTQSGYVAFDYISLLKAPLD